LAAYCFVCSQGIGEPIDDACEGGAGLFGYPPSRCQGAEAFGARGFRGEVECCGDVATETASC
jgi:hypothetical protein